jgi:hypothetical protein
MLLFIFLFCFIGGLTFFLIVRALLVVFSFLLPFLSGMSGRSQGRAGVVPEDAVPNDQAPLREGGRRLPDPT